MFPPKADTGDQGHLGEGTDTRSQEATYPHQDRTEQDQKGSDIPIGHPEPRPSAEQRRCCEPLMGPHQGPSLVRE